MKMWVFALLVVAAFSRPNPDNLAKLTSGFVEGLNMTALRDKLLPCATDTMWAAWEETIPQLRLLNTGDPAKVHEFVPTFFRIPFETLTFLRPCAKDEINNLNEFITAKTEKNPQFHFHLHKHSSEIFEKFQALAEAWDKSKYVEAGLRGGVLFAFIINN